MNNSQSTFNLVHVTLDRHCTNTSLNSIKFSFVYQKRPFWIVVLWENANFVRKLIQSGWKYDFELKISMKRLIFAPNTVISKRKWSFYCVKWWNSVISKLLILFWRNWFRQVKQIQVSPSPKKSFQWHQSKPIMRFGPFFVVF